MDWFMAQNELKGLTHSRFLELKTKPACVVVQYDLTSRKGNRTSSDIVEILTVKDQKIESSTIFFDTAAFAKFMSQ